MDKKKLQQSEPGASSTQPGTASTQPGTASTQRILIWDIWIRLFHWALVLCICFQLFSGQTGEWFFEDQLINHKLVGELVFALILFRLVWGFIGSSNLRFFNFIKSPFQAIEHLRHLLSGKVAPERGHNAAGAWAIVGMLFLIAVQATTGLFIADEDELLEGALYGLVDSELTETLLQVHYIVPKLIVFVIALHLIALLTYLLRAGQNLIMAMISGYMRWPDNLPQPPLVVQQTWVGLVVMAAVLIGTAIVGGWFS